MGNERKYVMSVYKELQEKLETRLTAEKKRFAINKEPLSDKSYFYMSEKGKSYIIRLDAPNTVVNVVVKVIYIEDKDGIQTPVTLMNSLVMDVEEERVVEDILNVIQKASLRSLFEPNYYHWFELTKKRIREEMIWLRQINDEILWEILQKMYPTRDLDDINVKLSHSGIIPLSRDKFELKLKDQQIIIHREDISAS